MTLTNYTPTHDAGDIPNIVIDAIVEMGVNLLPFAGLVVLVGLYIWFRQTV